MSKDIKRRFPAIIRVKEQGPTGAQRPEQRIKRLTLTYEVLGRRAILCPGSQQQPLLFLLNVSPPQSVQMCIASLLVPLRHVSAEVVVRPPLQVEVETEVTCTV